MADQGDKPWRVALCISRALGCNERLISGACRAAREAGDWDMLHVPYEQWVVGTLDWFKPQGVLFHGMRPVLPPDFRHEGLWVGVNDDWYARDGCVLEDDPGAGGKMAEFALARGFRRVIYVGHRSKTPLSFSHLRLRGLAAALDEAGIRPLLLPENYAQTVNPATRAKLKTVAEWIQQGEIPLFIGANDLVAADVLHFCRRQGWRVPEQAAVAGFDNDDLLCNQLANPGLTSLDMNFDRIGYEAGQMLQRFRRERTPGTGAAPERVVVPVGDIVSRHSTVVVVSRHAGLQKAMQRLWRHPDSVQRVADLMRDGGYAKSTLERLCRKTFQQTPAALVRNEKLTAAKVLLRTTNLSVKAVAAKVGFSSPKNLWRAFKRATGSSPEAYRAAAAASRD
ncbi:MAG: substrate-binding domain-containing protein [Lentisphaeria bacterium]